MTLEEEKQALHDEIKEEVKDELRHEDRIRRLRKTLGCLVVYLIVLGAPFIVVAVFVARSGLMQVPLLSSRLYKPVAPRAVVAPLVGTDAGTVWQEVAHAAKTDPKTGIVTLSMEEQQLTTAIRGGLATMSQSLPFPIEGAQVDVGDGDAELFFMTERGGREVPVSVVFVPGVANGQVNVDVLALTIGGAKVPQALAGSAASLLNSLLLSEFSANLPPGFSLESLVIENGKLVLKAMLPGQQP